jgi:hypothetical protein
VESSTTVTVEPILVGRCVADRARNGMVAAQVGISRPGAHRQLPDRLVSTMERWRSACVERLRQGSVAAPLWAKGVPPEPTGVGGGR